MQPITIYPHDLSFANDFADFWLKVEFRFNLALHFLVQRSMGSLVGLESGEMDAVQHMVPFLDEDDGLSVSEATLAPKPKPRAKPSAKLPGPLRRNDLLTVCHRNRHSF